MITVRTAAMVLLAVVVQATVIAPIVVFGARGDVVMLVALVAGLDGGRRRGAKVGFAVGLLLDLLLDGPAGLSALTYTLVGYGAGAVGGLVPGLDRRSVVVVAAVASMAGVLVYRVLTGLIGGTAPVGTTLLAIVGVVGLVSALGSLPALRVARWARRGPARRHPARRQPAVGLERASRR